VKPSLAELTVALITMFEGERLTAYADSGGIWTIGIGHTQDVHEGQVITHEQAIQYFIADCSPLLALVAGFPVLKGAALASFGFNCGIARLKDVLAGKDSIDLPRHTQDRHGNVLPGLVARRRIEKMLIDLS
jgi:GH24 family phage-related lysozyme (muramidase)